MQGLRVVFFYASFFLLGVQGGGEGVFNCFGGDGELSFSMGSRVLSVDLEDFRRGDGGGDERIADGCACMIFFVCHRQKREPRIAIDFVFCVFVRHPPTFPKLSSRSTYHTSTTARTAVHRVVRSRPTLD